MIVLSKRAEKLLNMTMEERFVSEEEFTKYISDEEYDDKTESKVE